MAYRVLKSKNFSLHGDTVLKPLVRVVADQHGLRIERTSFQDMPEHAVEVHGKLLKALSIVTEMTDDPDPMFLIVESTNEMIDDQNRVI